MQFHVVKRQFPTLKSAPCNRTYWVALINIVMIFNPIKLTITWRSYLTENSTEIEVAFLWGYLNQDQWSKITAASEELMNHVSYPGSLIMIQITPKEHTLSVIIIDFRNSKQEHTSKTTEFNVQWSLWWHCMTLNIRMFEVFYYGECNFMPVCLPSSSYVETWNE